MSRSIDHREARVAMGTAVADGIDQILAQGGVIPRTTKMTEPFGADQLRMSSLVFETRGPVESATFWGRTTQKTAVEAVGTVAYMENLALGGELPTDVFHGGDGTVVTEFSSTDTPGIITRTQTLVSPLKNGLVVVEFYPTDQPEEERVHTFSLNGEVRRFKEVGEERRLLQPESKDAEEQLIVDLLDTRVMIRAVNELNPGADVFGDEIDELLASQGISADEYFSRGQ